MKHSFDEKCLDLARYFYPNAEELELRDLAQLLQDTVESANICECCTRERKCPDHGACVAGGEL